MFSDDLKIRVEKMEREVDSLKSMHVELMRLSLSITNLTEQQNVRFNAVDSSLKALDNRLSRLEMVFYGLLAGLVTVFVGGILTALALPYIRANLF